MTATTDVEVLIVVYSRFGVLERLAEAIAGGARSVSGVQVHVLTVDDDPIGQLRAGETPEDRTLRLQVLTNRLVEADAIIVGSPAYFGSMASSVKRLFEDALTADAPPPIDRTRPWLLPMMRDKIGAAFTASATPHGGNEAALHSILTMFMHMGMIIVTPGQATPILDNPSAPYGATAVVGAGADQPPSDADLAAATALGERVARVASRLSKPAA